MTTQSTAEAMALLKSTRKKAIKDARKIAIELIRKNGRTHTREVLNVMEERSLVPSGRDFWLGAVFHHEGFRWTGAWHRYSDTCLAKNRNIHERTIKVWKLTSDPCDEYRPENNGNGECTRCFFKEEEHGTSN